MTSSLLTTLILKDELEYQDDSKSKGKKSSKPARNPVEDAVNLSTSAGVASDRAKTEAGKAKLARSKGTKTSGYERALDAHTEAQQLHNTASQSHMAAANAQAMAGLSGIEHRGAARYHQKYSAYHGAQAATHMKDVNQLSSEDKT